MSNPKPFHKRIALVLLFIFIPSLFPVNLLYASNNGPKAPEAASFEPVDATDMVNLNTGDLTYVLPLLNVPSPEGGYPLSIFNHSGIAFDQTASWTGLGWNINPGSINRGLVGVPDDNHNFKIQDVYYNLIDQYKDFKTTIGYGSESYGASLSYSTHKGFGGSVDYMGSGVAYNETDGISVNSSIFTYSENEGVGLSLGRVFKLQGEYEKISTSSQINIDLKYNFKSSGLSFDFGSTTSVGIVSTCVGFSLSSRGVNNSSALLAGGVGFYGGGGAKGVVSYSANGWTATIPILNTGFYVSVSDSKVKQWVFTNELNYCVGSYTFNHQYPEYLNNDFNDKNGSFYITDVFMRPPKHQEQEFSSSSLLYSDDSFEEINFPAYDNYQVNSQGINGNFSIKYYDNFLLPLGNKLKLRKNLDTDENDEYLIKYRDYLWERNDNTNLPYFYFNSGYSSYLEIKQTDSNLDPSNSSHWNLSSLSTNNSLTNLYMYSKRVSIINEGNGLGLNNKKRTGKVIETFTKKDFINGNLNNFIYATNNNIKLNYNDILSKSDSEYSVVGFKITDIDGKIYNYSLPVYQKEMIFRSEKTSNPNSKFSERRNFSSYADNWLLTSIIGSDYVDVNLNSVPDEGDYGYWVNFEYGKWSDGFGWKTSNRNTVAYEECENPVGNPSECTSVNYNVCSKGVKEVYYLNKIKTRTHSALFLKSLRSDANGISFQEGNSTSDPKIYNNISKSMNLATTESLVFSSGTFKSFYKVNSQKNFKLDKIVLIKNEDDDYFSNQIPKQSSHGGDFYFHESFQRWNLLGQYLGVQQATVHTSSWESEFYDNILETNEIISNEFFDKTLRVVSFDYDYTSGGKLTLKGISFNGHKNASLIPKYKFTYHKGLSSDNSVDLRWGYYKNNPEKWSLQSIENPLGSKMTIDYESDVFKTLKPTSSNVYNEGGIRVKSIKINDKSKIEYNYFYGVSTSRPEEIPNSILSDGKYEDDAFNINPQVFYKKVIENKFGETGNLINKIEYNFDIPQDGVDLLRFIEYRSINQMTPPYNNPPQVISNVYKGGGQYNIKKSSYFISDNTSAFGRLLSKKVFNSNNHMSTFAYNNYRINNGVTNEFANKKQGIDQEIFSSIKRTRCFYSDYDDGFLGLGSSVNNIWYSRDYYLMSASKVTYPNVLESTTVLQNGNFFTTNHTNFDFLTGEPLETTFTNSDGKTYKTKVVPAYLKYPQMGSKVDNIYNRNMLSQTAATYSYILDGGVWKETGVGITTWNNQWVYQDIGGSTSTPTADKEKIWRKHKSFIWNGVTDSNGIFQGYNAGTDDSFNWTVGVGTSQPPQWKQVSEVTLYDHYSAPLEVKDINSNKAATKMDVLNEKVESVGNAAYNEMFYSGAEITDGNGFYIGREVRNTNGTRTDEKAHTGKYSIKATNSSEFGVYMRSSNGHRAGKYKLSVWVHKDNESNARVRATQYGTPTAFNGERYPAGDWVLKTHYFDIGTIDFYAYVTSADGTSVYFDDLMIRPIASSITGYVYNEYDELTHIIGNNGLATRYEYDAGGRLIKTYVEIIDDPTNGVIGGFKLQTENKYHYKNL